MTPPTLLFFDPLCPYAWRGLELAEWLRREHGLFFSLHAYSLHEGNHPERAAAGDTGAGDTGGFALADQELTGQEFAGKFGESLRSFLGFYAAAEQGEAAGWAYALSLTRTVHGGGERRALSAALLTEAVQAADIDASAWQRRMAEDTPLRNALRADMARAGEIGVFGTPTFVLPSGDAAYFRFAHKPKDSQEALTLWNLYAQVLGNAARIETVKRPRRA